MSEWQGKHFSSATVHINQSTTGRNYRQKQTKLLLKENNCTSSVPEWVRTSSVKPTGCWGTWRGISDVLATFGCLLTPVWDQEISRRLKAKHSSRKPRKLPTFPQRAAEVTVIHDLQHCNYFLKLHVSSPLPFLSWLHNIESKQFRNETFLLCLLTLSNPNPNPNPV